MRGEYKWTSILAAVALALCLAAAAPAGGEDKDVRSGADRVPLTYDADYYRVKNIRPDDVLWIRKGAGTDYDKVGGLPHDASCVEVLDSASGWYYVHYRGISGWSSAKYLEWQDAANCLSPPRDYCASRDSDYRVTGVRQDDVLWIRSGPGTKYNKIGALPHNARCIEHIERSGGWVKVRYRGLSGWCSSKYLASDN